MFYRTKKIKSPVLFSAVPCVRVKSQGEVMSAFVYASVHIGAAWGEGQGSGWGGRRLLRSSGVQMSISRRHQEHSFWILSAFFLCSIFAGHFPICCAFLLCCHRHSRVQ